MVQFWYLWVRRKLNIYKNYQKTYQERWVIGTDGEKVSGNTVVSERYDDDEICHVTNLLAINFLYTEFTIWWIYQQWITAMSLPWITVKLMHSLYQLRIIRLASSQNGNKKILLLISKFICNSINSFYDYWYRILICSSF